MDKVEAIARYAVVAFDVGHRVLRNRHDATKPPSHPFLHGRKAVEPPFGELRPQRGGVAHLEAPVDGDGVVDRLEDREPGPLDAEDPVAEALIVVDDVELAGPIAQVLQRP